jgi:hypothetical protein
VNGKEIKSLRDVAEAAAQPVDGFIKIETHEDPKQLALDPKQIAEEAQSIQENYGLPALQRLE